MLARREHAVKELRNKLCDKGFDGTLVDDVLARLVDDNLVNDNRFIENYIRVRTQRGYGPVHIQADLKQRGLSDDMISAYVTMSNDYWQGHIRDVWNKRFHGQIPNNFNERGRQARFLQQRGFTHEQISRLFKQRD